MSLSNIDTSQKFSLFFQVDKEKVASIIAQALKKQEDDPDSATDGHSNGGGGGMHHSYHSPPASSASGPHLQEIRIEFERGGKGLGLSIAGGLGSTPYKLHDEGIFISRVTPGGPAHVAGLCKDDKVCVF